MPKLLSRSKHEEFKSNSALHINDQKERRAKSEEKMEHCEIWFLQHYSQPLHPASTVPAAPLFSCISRIVVFATIFGFSTFYPCFNHLCLDCMVFHLVCKAT